MKRNGFVLIFTLAILLALSGLAYAALWLFSTEIRSAGAGLLNMRAFYMAEAGRAKARYALSTGAQSVGWGEANASFGGGVYTVTTAYSDPPTNQHMTITSDGYIPDATNPIARRRVVEANIPLGAGSGTNLSLASNGTVAYSSPYQGQNGPDETIDGAQNTGWVSGVKQTSWIYLDYGSAKTVGRIVVSGSKINSIVVSYSNNGSSWTAVSNPSGALPGTRTFDAVTARYLRLDITSDSNHKAQVNEFESYAGPAAGPATLGFGSFTTSG